MGVWKCLPGSPIPPYDGWTHLRGDGKELHYIYYVEWGCGKYMAAISTRQALAATGATEDPWWFAKTCSTFVKLKKGVNRWSTTTLPKNYSLSPYLPTLVFFSGSLPVSGIQRVQDLCRSHTKNGCSRGVPGQFAVVPRGGAKSPRFMI